MAIMRKTRNSKALEKMTPVTGKGKGWCQAGTDGFGCDAGVVAVKGKVGGHGGWGKLRPQQWPSSVALADPMENSRAKNTGWRVPHRTEVSGPWDPCRMILPYLGAPRGERVLRPEAVADPTAAG